MISLIFGVIKDFIHEIEIEGLEGKIKKQDKIIKLLVVITLLTSSVAVIVLKDKNIFSKVKEYISQIDIKHVPKKLINLLEKVENDKKSLDNINDSNEINE